MNDIMLAVLIIGLWFHIALMLHVLMKQIFKLKGDTQQIKTAQRASQKRERLMRTKLDKLAKGGIPCVTYTTTG